MLKQGVLRWVLGFSGFGFFLLHVSAEGCQDWGAAAKVLQKDGGHEALGSCDAEAFLSDLLDDCHGGCPSAE